MRPVGQSGVAGAGSGDAGVQAAGFALNAARKFDRRDRPEAGCSANRSDAGAPSAAAAHEVGRRGKPLLRGVCSRRSSRGWIFARFPSVARVARSQVRFQPMFWPFFECGEFPGRHRIRALCCRLKATLPQTALPLWKYRLPCLAYPRGLEYLPCLYRLLSSTLTDLQEERRGRDGGLGDQCIVRTAIAPASMR